MMTYGGTDEVLSNNTEFPTLTRLSYTLNDFAKFYFAIFKVGGVTQLVSSTFGMVLLFYCLDSDKIVCLR